MDIKAKYHYTYFLNPFVIDEEKYEQFLLRLIKNEKWNFRMFDKVVDLEIYTHFLTQTKKTLFPSFYWSDEYKNKIKDMEQMQLAKELAGVSCVEFIYNLNDDCIMQGKVEQKNQIFFEINEIKLICFNTGICFVSFKTNIQSEDYIQFRDLLNFNFKFKQLSSAYSKYRANDNIYIQTNRFDTLESVTTFINSITDGYVRLCNDDIYSDRMFVYSYACIDESDWNNENTFEDIKDNFYKYAFQFSGDYDSKIELSDEEYKDTVYSKWEYSKYGFSKLGGVVFASAVDKFNYTNLPIHYEKVSFYIMLLAFYKRISLLTLDNKLMYSTRKQINKIKQRINNEMYNTRFSQITNSSHGMSLWKNWYRVFEIEELYNQLGKHYTRWLDRVKEVKSNLLFGFIIFILLLILGLNILGLI